MEEEEEPISYIVPAGRPRERLVPEREKQRYLEGQANLDLRMWRLSQKGDAKDEAVLSSYRTYRKRKKEQDFQYLELGRKLEAEREFQEWLPRLDGMFRGPEHFSDGFPKGHREFMDVKLARSADPAGDRMRMANKIFFEVAGGGKVKEELWDAQRTRHAREVLGWSGGEEELIDEGKFYELAGGKIAALKKEQDLSGKVAMDAYAGALDGLTLEAVRDRTIGIAGPDWHRYLPAMKGGYGAAQERYSDEELHAIRSLFVPLARREKVDPGEAANLADLRTGYRIYARADQAGRRKILEGNARMAELHGVTVEGWLAQQKNALIEGTDVIAGNLDAGMARRRAEELRGLIARGEMPGNITPDGKDLAADPDDSSGLLFQVETIRRMEGSMWPPGIEPPVTRAMTAGERKQLKVAAEILEGYASFHADAVRTGIDIRRDVDKLKHEGFWDTVADVTTLMSGSATGMTMALNPAGMSVLVGSYYERNLSHFRDVNPDMPLAEAKRYALGGAIAETALDRVEVLFLKAKLPAVQGTLAKWGKAGVVLNTAGHLGLRTVAGTATEGLQSITTDLTQELWSALEKDMPRPEWAAIRAREAAALGDNAMVSFGFSLVFMAGRKATQLADPEAIRKLLTDRGALRLSGFSRKVSEDVAALAETDPAAAAEMLKVEADRTPVETRRAQSEVEQQQIEQEQMEGGASFDPPSEGDKMQDPVENGGDAAEIRWNQDGGIWADPEMFEEILSKAKASGEGEFIDEGSEANVFHLGPDWVVKVPKPQGLMANFLPNWETYSNDPAVLEEKVKAIRKLGGLKTFAVRTEDGKLRIIQEKGTPITKEEFEQVELAPGIKPKAEDWYYTEIEGRKFVVSDLHWRNFLRDKEGQIRVSDLIAGEYIEGVSRRILSGDTPFPLDAKKIRDEE